jgi:hypothetical protein
MFISSYGNLRASLRERVRIDALAHLGPGLFAVGNPGTLQTAAYVLSRETNAQARNDSVGTYLRLVKEPDGEAKRRRFNLALANLRAAQPDPIVYRYRQDDFDAIPSNPWVYWLTLGLRRLFQILPKLEVVAEPRVGLQTSYNFRFLRYWWELGTNQICFGCRDSAEARATGKRWFPHMKGGSFRRWYGNQEYSVNWARDGAEIRNLGIERGRVESRPQNIEYYFRSGVTYSRVGVKTLYGQFLPPGFIFDSAVSCMFPENISFVMAVLNSQIANHAARLINPTFNLQVGDLGRIPMPVSSGDRIDRLVDMAIGNTKSDSEDHERTYDFIAPPSWLTGIEDVANSHRKLAEIERDIDEEVYRLYGISDEDRAAIESELAEPTVHDMSDGESEDFNSDTEDAGVAEEAPLTSENLARQWISYAVGIVMGRFQPGIDGALGRGHFSEGTAVQLRALADSDGILGCVDEFIRWR